MLHQEIDDKDLIREKKGMKNEEHTSPPPAILTRQPDDLGKKADRKEMRDESTIYNLLVSPLRESFFLKRGLYFIWCHEAEVRRLGTKFIH